MPPPWWEMVQSASPFLSLFGGGTLACSSLLDSQKLYRSSRSLDLRPHVCLTKASQSYQLLVRYSFKPFYFHLHIHRDSTLIYFSPSCSSSFSSIKKKCSGRLINSDILPSQLPPTESLVNWMKERDSGRKVHSMITGIPFQAQLNQMQKEVIRHEGCGLSFL